LHEKLFEKCLVHIGKLVFSLFFSLRWRLQRDSSFTSSSASLNVFSRLPTAETMQKISKKGFRDFYYLCFEKLLTSTWSKKTKQI
jgi:hypothetical protein